MSKNNKTPEEMAMEAKQLAEQQAKEKQEAKIAERKALMEAKIKAAQGESSYLADEKERDLYHIKLDKPAYSPKDGKKLSKAFIQKFSVSDWKNHLKHGAGLGFTHDVLWNPEAYAQA